MWYARYLAECVICCCSVVKCSKQIQQSVPSPRPHSDSVTNLFWRSIWTTVTGVPNGLQIGVSCRQSQRSQRSTVDDFIECFTAVQMSLKAMCQKLSWSVRRVDGYVPLRPCVCLPIPHSAVGVWGFVLTANSHFAHTQANYYSESRPIG